MAEAPSSPVQSEEVRVKGTFAGQAVDLAAKGTTIILLFALAVIGYLALREHGNRTSAEKQIMGLLSHQNELLGSQTDVLKDGQREIECQLGIDIFVHQFQRGGVDWDMLPPQLHGCYPDYAKKMPRPQR
jgi:hypothetical protein